MTVDELRMIFYREFPAMKRMIRNSAKLSETTLKLLTTSGGVLYFSVDESDPDNWKLSQDRPKKGTK